MRERMPEDHEVHVLSHLLQCYNDTPKDEWTIRKALRSEILDLLGVEVKEATIAPVTDKEEGKVISPLIVDKSDARYTRCKDVKRVKETKDIDQVNEMLARKDEDWRIIDTGPDKVFFILGRTKA